MAEKTNRLNVCLIKPDYQRFEDIVIEGADAHPIDGVGVFYTEASHPRQPEWFRDFFGDALVGEFRLIASSARGLLLVGVADGDQERIFAVIFGQGRHLLQEGVIEDRFGLKVVLNVVDPVSLRSIDKTTLGSVPKQSREQMSKEGMAANFGIDIEQDLINAVTGRSREATMGTTVSGKDALGVSAKIDVRDIAEFLQTCLHHYKSEAYKAEFAWVDQIRDVRNSRETERLDDVLVARLRAKELDKIWMAPPEIIDWIDIKGFRYVRPKKAEIQADLHIGDLLDILGDQEISLELLKKISVHAVSARTEEAFMHWSAYRCIYAEIEVDGKIYLLNNGKWYEIAKDFTDEVSRAFNAIPEAEIDLPDYAHDSEGAYNDSLPAAIPGSCSMDRKMINHGGGQNKIEFCDLLTGNRQLVHIKRYGGSSLLSHLFAQGTVSGELFVQDEAFREKLNEKLPVGHKLADHRTRPIPSDYEVVFGIISGSQKPLDIPFFSKVSLRNAYRRLGGYGYRVTKKKIPHAQ